MNVTISMNKMNETNRACEDDALKSFTSQHEVYTSRIISIIFNIFLFYFLVLRLFIFMCGGECGNQRRVISLVVEFKSEYLQTMCSSTTIVYNA